MKPALIDYLSQNAYNHKEINLLDFDLQRLSKTGQSALLYVCCYNKEEEINLTSHQLCYLIDKTNLDQEDRYGKSILSTYIECILEEELGIPEQYFLKILRKSKNILKKLHGNVIFTAIVFEKHNKLLSSKVWGYLIDNVNMQALAINGSSILSYTLFYSAECKNLTQENWKKLVNKTFNFKKNKVAAEATLRDLCQTNSKKELMENFSKIWRALDNKEEFIEYVERGCFHKICQLSEFISYKEKCIINQAIENIKNTPAHVLKI